MITEAVIHAFQAALGTAHVRLTSAELRAAENATFPTDQSIPIILQPANDAEVAACVRLAARFGVSLYPISSGKNWGYGSRVPPQSPSALLDLRRLNRILDYDPKLAYARVECGVTQGQLHAFLKQKGDALWLDPTSSSVDCSVIGNALERGHGMTPYADHASTIADLKVVLASGGMIRTGYGDFPGAKTAPLDTWAPGPNLDGLFSQSNLGIVTEATIWLLPKPERVIGGFVNLRTSAELVSAVDLFRTYRLHGLLPSGPHVANDIRLIQSLAPFPWSQTPPNATLPAALRQQLRDETGAPPWHLAFGLHGFNEDVGARQARINKDLKALGLGIEWRDSQFARPAGNFAPLTLFRERLFDSMCGELPPPLIRPFWKQENPDRLLANDLDQARVGFIWLPFAVPFDGAEIDQATRLFERCVNRHGFDADINFNSVRPRVLHIYASLVYDRQTPGEDGRAMRCQTDLGRVMMDHGYYPQRFGLHSMDWVTGMDHGNKGHLPHDRQDVLKKIRDAFDPGAIISPKRYLP